MLVGIDFPSLFTHDNFTSRRTTGCNLYDPESLLTGFEIGAGFKSVAQKGTEHGDALTPEGFVGNNAGGILGGISTGQDITASIAIKPTSSIRSPRPSIDKSGQATAVETFGRHDPCVGIRATPIAEAMLALVLMDHALRHRAQCGDVRVATPQIAAAR